MSMLNRKRGKNTERALAKKLNMRRVGILGKHDLEDDYFNVEVKHRKRFVAEKWLQQVEKVCPETRVPLVVVHTHGQDHDNDIILFRLKDFKDFMKYF